MHSTLYVVYLPPVLAAVDPGGGGREQARQREAREEAPGGHRCLVDYKVELLEFQKIGI